MFQHYLSECQLYLEAVPAMFRLELLENIFSLLFLSNTDFYHHAEACVGSTETQINGAAGGEQQTTSNDKLTEDFSANAETEDSSAGLTDQGKSPEEPETKKSCRDTFPELSHLISGCRGFLLDTCGMEGILRLLREGLEGVCAVGQVDGRVLGTDAQLAESLGCSVTVDTFSARLQRLSKRTAEASWRLQIITSNQGNGTGEFHSSYDVYFFGN